MILTIDNQPYRKASLTPISSTMAQQNILIVGATGKQGGAVIKALLKSPSPPHILALTRNPDSAHAKSLAAAHKDIITLIQGDITNPQPIFASQPKGSITGLFLLTNPGTKVPEEDQAIPLIDAAVAHGVKHIVFTSVDRGGDEKSWSNPTDIKHFAAKHHIEVYLRDKAAKEEGGNKFTWTILRPVAFFDNWLPGTMSAMFTAMWAASLRPATKLQLVSVHDIGVFAAMAFQDPGKWAGRAVGLAGDELTLEEAQSLFKRGTGKPLPQAWTIFGKMVLWGMGEVGRMFRWFDEEGYGVDIEARRREAGGMQNFEAWLREESGWLKQ